MLLLLSPMLQSVFTAADAAAAAAVVAAAAAAAAAAVVAGAYTSVSVDSRYAISLCH